MVEAYLEQLKEIVDGDRTELLKMAVRMPDVLKTEREELSQEELNSLEDGVDEALKEVLEFRSSEGKALEKDLWQRKDNIQQLLEKVVEMDSDRIDGVRNRLKKGDKRSKGAGG